MKKAGLKIAGIFLVLALLALLCKVYLLPLFYQPAIYRISETELKYLEESITSDPNWKTFLGWFPKSALPFTMPSYYHEGISKPLFLAERNMEIDDTYTVSLWLFAYIDTNSAKTNFLNCKLQIDYMQGHHLVASYTLNDQETQQAFTAQTRDEFIAYLLENVYPQ